MNSFALLILVAIAESSGFAGEDTAGQDSVAASGATVFTATAPSLGMAQYKLSGNRSLLPNSISDDGVRTHIQWGPSQSLPAVFGLDERGGEELVNGHMRDGTFTIDRVYARLVFRIDDAKASARRTSVHKK